MRKCFPSKTKFFLKFSCILNEIEGKRQQLSRQPLTNYVEMFLPFRIVSVPQPAITCSKLRMGTLEQGVKYVQS